uniref:Secreted protein n=1 Tax=Strongyloides venezuelensis TaxID=75913 RepID=A0A0K0FCA2_STRVS
MMEKMMLMLITIFFQKESFSSISGEDESKDTQDSWSHIITKPLRWKFSDPASDLNKNLVNEMIDFIVKEINRYVTTKDSALILTENVEMRKFLAVVIQMRFKTLLRPEENICNYESLDPYHNWSTNVPLARTLIKNKTNVVGTIRKSRPSLPKSVTSSKLKKG